MNSQPKKKKNKKRTRHQINMETPQETNVPLLTTIDSIDKAKRYETLIVTLRHIGSRDYFPLLTIKFLIALSRFYTNDVRWNQIWNPFEQEIDENFDSGFKELEKCQYEDYHRKVSNRARYVLNKHRTQFIIFIKGQLKFSDVLRYHLGT